MKQSKRDKIKMYMKLPKKKLAEMLWAANEFIDSVGPVVKSTSTLKSNNQKCMPTTANNETLERIKDEVAASKNWTSWKTVPKKSHDDLWPEVCRRFAHAVALTRLIAPEQTFEDVLGKSMKAHGLTDELPDHLKTPDFLFKEGPKSTVLGQGYHIKKEFPKEQKDINVTQLKDKPDFEAIASKMYYDNHDEDTAHILQYAMNFVWSSHVEPLQKTLSRYSSQEVQISNLQSEITRLKKEKESLKDRIKCLINEGEQPPF